MKNLLLKKFIVFKILLYKLVQKCVIKFEDKKFEIFEYDYNLRYEAFDYTIKIKDSYNWNDYLITLWDALHSIENFYKYQNKVIWFQDIELGNRAIISINKVVSIDDNLKYEDFYIRFTYFNNYSKLVLGKDSYMNLSIRFFDYNYETFLIINIKNIVFY